MEVSTAFGAMAMKRKAAKAGIIRCGRKQCRSQKNVKNVARKMQRHKRSAGFANMQTIPQQLHDNSVLQFKLPKAMCKENTGGTQRPTLELKQATT